MSTKPTPTDDIVSSRPRLKVGAKVGPSLKDRIAANLDKLMDHRADGSLWVVIDADYSVKWDGNCFVLFEARRVSAVVDVDAPVEEDADARVKGYRGRGYFSTLPDALRRYVMLSAATSGAATIGALTTALQQTSDAISNLEKRLCL